MCAKHHYNSTPHHRNIIAKQHITLYMHNIACCTGVTVTEYNLTTVVGQRGDRVHLSSSKISGR